MVNILFLRRNTEDLTGALKNYHQFCLEVAKIAECKFAGEGWPLHIKGEPIDKTVKRLYGDDSPDWVIDSDLGGFKPVHNRSYRFGAFISDLHGKYSYEIHSPGGFINLIKYAGYDAVFSKYRFIFGRGVLPHIFVQRLGKTLVFLPWSAGYDEFQPEAMKMFDVAFLGSVGGVYDFRNMLKNQLAGFCKANNLRLIWKEPVNKSLWDIKNIDYSRSAKHFYGSRYAEILNHSRSLILGCSTYKYPLLKLFEGLAAGCLVMSTRPSSAEELGFVDGETYVEVDKNNWKKKLVYYSIHKDEADRIALNGRKLFEERHTREIRAREFVAVLEGFNDD